MLTSGKKNGCIVSYESRTLQVAGKHSHRWMVYGRDNSLCSVDKKIISISASELSLRSDPLFLPGFKQLKLNDIASDDRETSIQFSLEEKRKEISESNEISLEALDFYLSILEEKRNKTLWDYVEAKLNEYASQDHIKYYISRYILQKAGCSIDRTAEDEPKIDNLGQGIPAFVTPEPISQLDQGVDEQVWQTQLGKIRLRKIESGSYIVYEDENGLLKKTQTFGLTKTGKLFEENTVILDLNPEKLHPLSVQFSNDCVNILFFYDIINISKLSGLVSIEPHERGVVGILDAQGLAFLIENPYYDEDNRFSKFSLSDKSFDPSYVIPWNTDPWNNEKTTPLFLIKTKDLRARLSCAADINYPNLFKLLGIEDGSPLVFNKWFKGNRILQQRAKYAIPLKRLLKRSYCWLSNEGKPVFFENEPPYRFGDDQRQAYNVEIKSGKTAINLPDSSRSVLILDSLRLKVLQGNQITFEMKEIKSSINQQTPVSLNEWNLTFIADGKSGKGRFNLNNAHARAYLQTPASSKPIEIHLSNAGLLVAEVGNLKERKRSQVVSIEPRLKFIKEILADIKRDIRLGDNLNCSQYVLRLFEYAEKPFVSPSFVNAHTFSYTKHIQSGEGGEIVRETRTTKVLETLRLGHTMIQAVETQNGLEYYYQVIAQKNTGTSVLLTDQSGFQRSVQLNMSGDSQLHISLKRVGPAGLVPWTALKKTVKLEQKED